MLSEERAKIVEQLRIGCPETIIDSVCALTDRARNSKTRIEEEGEVVRDQKGSIIAHPAIQIERESIKAASDLIMKWHRRKPGRSR